MKNQKYDYYDLVPKINNLKEMVTIHNALHPDHIAFTFPTGRKQMKSKTFYEVYSDMNALGSVLFQQDIQNKHVAIIGENCYEWIIIYLSLVNGGNIAVPIDKELDAKEIKQLIQQADCDYVFISDTYKDKISILSDHTILFSKINEMIEEGRPLLDHHYNSFIQYEIDSKKLASIFFTSGTTGKAKGVMLSHENIAYNIVHSASLFKLSGNVVSVLPFHHTFGLITSSFTVYHYGFSNYIVKSLKTMQKDMQLYKPETMFLVPLFVESFQKNIEITIKKEGKVRLFTIGSFISNLLLKAGIDIRRYVFKDILNHFGGNLKYIISGGAPLDTKLIPYYRQFGIQILNGFGITECSPVISVNRNHWFKDGSVGVCIPGTKVKLADDKEILFQGKNVMLGYYKDLNATNEVIQDGWYYTGDLGYIDEEGFIFITGRKKNLIINSNGENISPEELEIKLKDEHVREVMVYAVNNEIVAEFYPEESFIGNQTYFEGLVEKVNMNQPSYKQITRVKLRNTEFKKNSTKKIIRYKRED